MSGGKKGTNFYLITLVKTLLKVSHMNLEMTKMKTKVLFKRKKTGTKKVLRMTHIWKMNCLVNDYE